MKWGYESLVHVYLHWFIDSYDLVIIVRIEEDVVDIMLSCSAGYNCGSSLPIRGNIAKIKE